MLSGRLGVDQRSARVAAEAFALRLAGGDDDAALLGVSTVDARRLDDSANLVDRLLGCLTRSQHGAVTVERPYAAALPETPEDTHPPFRPDGPYPAISRSSTTTRRSGWSDFR